MDLPGSASPDSSASGGGGASGSTLLMAPTPSLPKGGGAVRGLGEKLSANPVTGTGSMAIPLPFSDGRAGFSPRLQLQYDSAAGAGVFGFGWSLGLPAITRKTDKTLPRYEDPPPAAPGLPDSDTFVIAGMEDLVPVVDAGGGIVDDPQRAPGWLVRRFRPRLEGSFARIERWTRVADPADVHWRMLSGDNVLTVYGRDAESRLFDPERPERIYSWLICEERNDRGDAVVYRYKAEDAAGVDLAVLHERGRGDAASPARTANRHLKRICYGAAAPLLDATGRRPDFLAPAQVEGPWLFEAVFDYGEHDSDAPAPGDTAPWAVRSDPLSSYRGGFELRTYRLCRRMLMFHHFPGEPDVGADCLVSSLALAYDESPQASVLVGAARQGHRRQAGGYLTRALPPVEFEYTKPRIGGEVLDVDPVSLENVPVGVDGTLHAWVDLDGEGLPGIVSDVAGGWFYKRNQSALPPEHGGDGRARFAPLERLDCVPAGAHPADGWTFADLSGDGLLDLVRFTGPEAGFFERTEARRWSSWRRFSSAVMRPDEARGEAVDLNGDGRSDLVVDEGDALLWYPSLGEEGFAAPTRTLLPSGAGGPRLADGDPRALIRFIDMTGDGLPDLVRIRSGSVAYLPNCGNGRFGPMIEMDGAPEFDAAGEFDPGRLRVVDIDGSGPADLVYFGRHETTCWFNLAGNGWSRGNRIAAALPVDNMASVEAVDLLGNGTACLVWSLPLAADAGRSLRYLPLMADGKPHLLAGYRNNLGTETRLAYAPSTAFYLADRQAGRPWLTRLPFPVHVVTAVETFDRVARTRFETRYAYHHGHFDGAEREFCGFGMVEEWDSAEYGALGGPGAFPPGDNEDPASHVPPTLTRSWYHLGLHQNARAYADALAGLAGDGRRGEYYRDPGFDDAACRASLLPDSLLPPGLSLDEEREAARALKGTLIRRETYFLDGSTREGVPYTVAQLSKSVRCIQRRGANRHGVFLALAGEALDTHYERDPVDPRALHTILLDADPYGLARHQVEIAYGRLLADDALSPGDQAQQAETLIAYVENGLSNAVDDVAAAPGDYRKPALCEMRRWQLRGYTPTGTGGRYRAADFLDAGGQPSPLFDHSLEYQQDWRAGRCRRLVEHHRILFRPDDLGVAAGDPASLLPLAVQESRALPGETYKLTYTAGLLSALFARDGVPLVPAPETLLGQGGPGGGGYVESGALIADGRFPASDPAGAWWAPSGRVYASPDPADGAAAELAYARAHFFLPLRYRDPFFRAAHASESRAILDAYDLLPLGTIDAEGNRVTVGERLADGSADPAGPGNDYRVLAPWKLTDANGNRSAVAFDALGLVVATAAMGKPDEGVGDALDIDPDPPEADIAARIDDPLAAPGSFLGSATSRLLYDPWRYWRTASSASPQPAACYTMQRERHAADLAPGAIPDVQHRLEHLDGAGRTLQRKSRGADDPLTGSPRWIVSSWTVVNNKGDPVRTYDPTFSPSPAFEFAPLVGEAVTTFYDGLGRPSMILRPDGAYTKTIERTWFSEEWDANDTALLDPRTDPDVAGACARFFAVQPAGWETWHARRSGGSLGAEEAQAASAAAAHAGTAARFHCDALGRTIVAAAHGGFRADGSPIWICTRSRFDIEGEVVEVRDADGQGGDIEGRVASRFRLDMLGAKAVDIGLDDGRRWVLRDVAGAKLVQWGERPSVVRHDYDRLRRPTYTRVSALDPADPARFLVTERVIYGERHPAAAALNLAGARFAVFDQAGRVINRRFDFKGNLLESERAIARVFDRAVDWGPLDAAPAAAPPGGAIDLARLAAVSDPELDGERYLSANSFDALNRLVETTTPASAAMKANRLRPRYQADGSMSAIDVNLQGAGPPGAPVWTPFVTAIEHNARGQRRRIVYGNGVVTEFDHDPLTTLLRRVRSRRPAPPFAADCPAPPVPGWPGCGIQDLAYTYDAAGNVVHLADNAQQAVFFRNRRVEPSCRYRYDPLYRLVEATGRELLGLSGPEAHSPDDAGRTGLDWSANDGGALGRYTEQYLYDAVGNLLELRHRGDDPVHPGWTRRFFMNQPSRIEDGSGGTLAKTGNRLGRTETGNGPAAAQYRYDAHGNMVYAPHLGGAAAADNMAWDAHGRLVSIDKGGGGRVFYRYDSAGRRIRKVWRKTATASEERIYLGGVELCRRRAGANLLVRETLHVSEPGGRAALVETRTRDDAGTATGPARAIRYQLGNHLGSAMLDLDEGAKVVAYEEYSPFGATVYQAVEGAKEVPRRYRFAGKERDEESGFYHYGARYYAPWIARWISPDPSGAAAGVNSYEFVGGNPVRLGDPDGRDWRDELNPLQKAALWVDDRVQESPVARGVFNNLAKRGEQLINAPAAIKEKYEKDGALGVAEGVAKGAVHLVKDTADAAADVGYYGAQYYYEGDEHAKEMIASRSLDIVLNIADIVTIADGAGAAKNAAVGGGKALASTARATVEAVKDLGTGGMVTAEGVVLSGGSALAKTGKPMALMSVAQDGAKATALMMGEAKTATGGGGSGAGPKSVKSGGGPAPKQPHQVNINKAAGTAREVAVGKELVAKYPGASVQAERFLRTADGKIARDWLTGEARRIDHVVIKDGKAIEAVEVTSETADKAAQIAKENRIRADGGTFIRDKTTGKLVDISKVPTQIVRRK